MGTTTTTISTDQTLTTLVNVFTVAPEAQQSLVDLLVTATENVMAHRPGFVSANIHASLDGTRVTNYAQWSTEEDFQTMLSDPDAREHSQPSTPSRAPSRISTAWSRSTTARPAAVPPRPKPHPRSGGRPWAGRGRAARTTQARVCG